MGSHAVQEDIQVTLLSCHSSNCTWFLQNKIQRSKTQATSTNMLTLQSKAISHCKNINIHLFAINNIDFERGPFSSTWQGSFDTYLLFCNNIAINFFTQY